MKKNHGNEFINAKKINYFMVPHYLICDGDCDHAWGINWDGRKKRKAPACTGTWEGGHGKPNCYHQAELMNKWCARECERSIMLRREKDEKFYEDSKEIYEILNRKRL